MPKLDITSQERSALRAAAHPLRPVVLIGDRGLTEPVLKEIDLNLTAHNLIKVRVSGEERAARDTMLETICETLSCAAVHHLGKTLIIYRPDPAVVQAEAEAVNATRASRKPNEPHTPKKEAAAGITRTRKGQITERAARKTERLESAAPKARRVDSSAKRSAPSASASSPHGIPRRSGSAMSLRAGARRNVSSRGGKR